VLKKVEYIWLSKLNISNNIKEKAIERLGGVKNFFNSSLDDLVYLGLNDRLILKILDKKSKDEAKKDFEFINKNNIDIIGIEDINYPEKLRLINDKPICFYIRGNKNILNNKSIAIVGARIAKKESLEVSKLLSNILVSRGINVISGLARGIDKYAHLGAIEINSKGKTIAILGNGIDDSSIYPYENKKLFERILENDGSIISEYPIFTKPFSYNFPYRNRIISGLSDAVIVVQAFKNSGSLITVDYALSQGKDVFVYKNSNINDEYFLGNKMLIEDGAKIIKIF